MQQLGLVRFILILILAFVLVRFLPAVARIVQAATTGLSGYWWTIFSILIIAQVIRQVIKRRLAAKKSESQFEDLPIRDVTKSAKDE